jgi:CBS domain-containing protein
MFSIYEYDRRVFRNTLEELYKVNPIEPSAASLRPDPEMKYPQSKSRINKEYVPNNNALEAYRDLIHAKPKDELKHAYEIMQKDFIVLKDTQTAFEALDTLHYSQLDALPVINDKNCITGLFSDKAITEKLLNNPNEQLNLRITSLNSWGFEKVITAEPVTSIRRIAEVMSRYNLSVVPIVDAYDEITGIVTGREIAQAISNDPPISIWT